LLATLHDHEEEVKKAADSRMEGAMVAIDPMTGAVRALVGGRDYYESNFNRSTQVQIPLFNSLCCWLQLKFLPINYSVTIAVVRHLERG
jgi:cell division protein FtsI/penicillin-binding protein 2